MAGLTPRLAALLFLTCSAGCVSLTYDRDLIGTGRFAGETWKLEPDQSTLSEVFEVLGPPDLILRVGHVDRAYYTSWDASYFKVVAGASLPLVGRNVSWDLFILTLGGEMMRMARLEFDREGVLRDLQKTTIEMSRGGQYLTMDDRIVSTFLEDRSRLLRIKEEDDDEEDVELDKRPPE